MNKSSGKIVTVNGIQIFQPNDVYRIKDNRCYISYNSHISDYGCETTALVREDGVRPTKFLILNGNHVEEYLKLETYEDCVEYFKSHLELKNKFSENWDEEIIVSDGRIYFQKVLV